MGPDAMVVDIDPSALGSAIDAAASSHAIRSWPPKSVADSVKLG